MQHMFAKSKFISFICVPVFAKYIFFSVYGYKKISNKGCDEYKYEEFYQLEDDKISTGNRQNCGRLETIKILPNIVENVELDFKILHRSFIFYICLSSHICTRICD